MADIRIKDLTTTASSTASDDFFAADGTTNGTRKLSAYSPSFGGNATVGGTLTVNGVATAGSYLTSAAGLAFPGALSASGYYLYSGSANGLTMYGYGSTYDVYIGNRAGTRALSVAANSTVVSIPDTTASTTTSSGALVVGNGTSGGLGVGGNAYIGGDLVVATGTKGIYSQGYVTVKGQQANFLSRGQPSGWTAGLHFYTAGNDYSASIIHYPDNGNLQFYINATSSNYAASDEALRITTAKQVQVLASTASTSTSSGALVVSGGVGVAGAIYAGGDVFVVKADPSSTLTRTANTNSALFQLTTGATYDFAFGLRNTTDSDFHLYNYGTSSDALTIARASSNVTFAGTVIANASSNAFRITTAQTPASAGATGTAGTICWDTSYIYVCTATNTWKRVAISTW
jgi:hypothetical protein